MTSPMRPVGNVGNFYKTKYRESDRVIKYETILNG